MLLIYLLEVFIVYRHNHLMFLPILYQFLIDMCELKIYETEVYLGGNFINIVSKFCLYVGAHLFSDLN